MSMQFKLTLLGTNSATPAYDRFTSAQVLEVQGHAYLIDCGEGAQIRMQQYGIKKGRINQIFISHLHGDHINGLIGFLTSIALNGRIEPIEIFAPKGLAELLRAYDALTGGGLPYPCLFHDLDTASHQILFEDQLISVSSIPLDHRVPCSGFLFKEKERPRKIKSNLIDEYQIPYTAISGIKAGADWENPQGSIISNEVLTEAPVPARSYAYCSDTAYTESILPIIEGVDLLYHEATYCEDGASLAKERGHSTAKEAATIAQKAAVKQLVLGHYSSRYKSLSQFQIEANAVFPDTIIGHDGMVLEIPFSH